VRKIFQNVLKQVKIGKMLENENPIASRGSVCLEAFRKLGGKF